MCVRECVCEIVCVCVKECVCERDSVCGGDSFVVGCPPLALWVAGSSLVRIWSLDGGRGIVHCYKARDWVTGYSGGGRRLR